MLQKYDRPDDRMEALLRLWGAEQAAQRQDLPAAPPVLKPIRLDLRYAFLCAGCVAAGAIVAIGAMLLAQRGAAKESRPIESVPTRTGEESPAVPNSETEPRISAAESTSDISPSILEVKLANMRSQRDEALVMAALADNQRKQLAEEAADLQKQLEQANRTKQAVAQLDRKVEALRKEQDAALAMSSRLRKKLASFREQHRMKCHQMLEVYLGALAPKQSGLEAIQAAARTSRLLERCAALRAKEKNGETLKTLDRIEAALIRLDFLDTNDVTGIIRFEHQLRRSDLLADISASLLRESSDRDLPVFLAEADLILSGVQRAG